MDIKELVKQKIKEAPIDPVVGKREMAAAVHALAVAKYGADAVGDVGDYIKKPSGYWTKERCKEDALKYKTRGEWAKLSKSACSTAEQKNWKDWCCSHMPPPHRVPNGSWTRERVLESARKHAYYTDWVKVDNAAAMAARRNGWYLDCVAHMGKKVRPNGTWTLELCMESAKKYSTKRQWRDGDPAAKSAARKHGWIQKCSSHMYKCRRDRDDPWTKDQCIEIARKYKTVSEWQRSCDGAAYTAANRNGWSEECKQYLKRD